MDHVIGESMKTLDILSPVKRSADDHVFDFVTGGAQDIFDRQLRFDEEEEEEMEVSLTDFTPGIVKCISLSEYDSTIKEASTTIMLDACMGENSNYYTLFQSALKRFYLDVKRFLITQSYRKKQNDPSLQVSSDEDEIKRKCYDGMLTVNFCNSLT